MKYETKLYFVSVSPRTNTHIDETKRGLEDMTFKFKSQVPDGKLYQSKTFDILK